MTKIYITASHYSLRCAEAKKMLEDKGFEFIETKSELPYTPFEELAKIVPEIDAAVVGMDNWNEDVFKLAPKLKVIARFGVGVDNIDVVAAKKYGIKVINARGQNSNAVAELAVAFMLNVLRNVNGLHINLMHGKWTRFMGHDIKEKTVGLLGFGDIARRTAKKLSGFDVNIIAYDTFPDEAAAARLNVRMTTMDEVLTISDILSLHIPNTPENYHIMNDKMLAAMKQGSYLINTARGGLVDSGALYRAVKSGHLSGAALDVYENEPIQAGDPLLTLESIICTPHTAAETYETYRVVGISTAQGIIDVLEGRDPANWLNK